MNRLVGATRLGDDGGELLELALGAEECAELCKGGIEDRKL